MSLRVSAIIFQLFKVIMPEKCALTILELNWNQGLGQDRIEHSSSYARVVHTTAKQVISRHRKNENEICGGFVAVVVLASLAPRKEHIFFAHQTWKPQFLSVVQFPFDNCHSPFSPTTFFEIGVCDIMKRRKENSPMSRIRDIWTRA